MELSEQPLKGMMQDGTVFNKQETVGQRLRHIRTMRTRFPAIAESIESLWISFLYGKDDIVLDDGARKMLGEDVDDIDGEGTDFDSFVKWHVTANYLLYGRPIVLVDAPPIDADNRRDQLENGLRPTMDVLDNLDVKDWQLAKGGKDKGQYAAIRFEYEEMEDRASLEDEPRVVVKCRTLTLVESQLRLIRLPL